MDGEDDTEDDKLRGFFPSAFGQGHKGTDIDAQIHRTKRATANREGEQEPRPRRKEVKVGGASDDDSDDEASDEDSDEEFPTSHELVLKTQERAVTTISIDSAGSRMVTGSTDCTIKLHDFASMTPTTLRAFKSVDPTASRPTANAETHPIHVAKFNPNSPSQVLVISATPQARILSRDGEVVSEFHKGDMYLRDMNMTKGHISEICAGTWHPTNPEVFATAGTDSTVRIWDVNTKMKQKSVIVHKSRRAGSGGRSRMTAVAWGNEASPGKNNLLVAAALDGSLMMWNGDGPYHRPSAEIRDAHQSDTWTSGLAISPDGRLVISRGGDDTVKLWDTRKFRQAVFSIAHASTSAQYPTSNIQFSPDGSSIILGSEDGNLHILNPARLKPELVTPVTPGVPLITVLWHEKLNQIVTGSANAETHLLYSPKISSKGAVMIMSKAPKRRHVDDDANLTTDMAYGLSGDSISTPSSSVAALRSSTHASRQPTMGLTASGKSRDPRRPHIPATTPFAKNQPDQKHVKSSFPLSSMRDEDPREALLKYADKADQDPLFTNAWKQTQPTTFYAELSDGDEEDKDEGPERKKAKT